MATHKVYTKLFKYNFWWEIFLRLFNTYLHYKLVRKKLLQLELQVCNSKGKPQLIMVQKIRYNIVLLSLPCPEISL